VKPQLAEDADLDAVIFPCGVQPKFDGVRAGVYSSVGLTGRSLDPFAGFGITDYFSRPEWIGYDGEMVLGENPYSTDRLCHLTAGAMGKFKGVTTMANLHWHLFDLVNAETEKWPYLARYMMLRDRLAKWTPGGGRLHLVPMDIAENRQRLNQLIQNHIDLGAEGTIIRNLNALPKPGRPTKSGQQLWRVKSWMTGEIRVDEIIEGASNRNEAKTNSLGKTERSSAKAGKVPNGQIGSLKGPLLEDLIHPHTGVRLLKQGTMVTVSKGEMSTAEAKAWFEDPSQILKWAATFKCMPHGMKDVLRMPTFKSKRLRQDMSRVKRRIR